MGKLRREYERNLINQMNLLVAKIGELDPGAKVAIESNSDYGAEKCHVFVFGASNKISLEADIVKMSNEMNADPEYDIWVDTVSFSEMDEWRNYECRIL